MNGTLDSAMQQVLNVEPGTEVNAPETPSGQVTTEAGNEGGVQQQNPNVVDQPTTQQDGQEDNTVIRQMRDQLNKYKQEGAKDRALLQKIADSQGISLEELEASIQAKEDKKKAETMGVSPEIAARMRQQDERIQQLEQQSIQEDFNHRANAFAREYRLNEQQMQEFYKQAMANGIDILKKGVNLTVVYRALNFDRLSKESEASIRQQILNDMQAQRENANGVPAVTSNPANPEDNTNDSDFKRALLKAFKNN